MDKFFEEDDTLLAQLNVGDYFWISGSLYEVAEPVVNRMIVCNRIGHADKVMLDANTVVQPSDR